ncbi:host attachment protein [Thioclava sp. BHET1]|uniref:Host attachment protein n=1 Tax=Thioclava dalianensis TaxID=1185766 RepID=A0A074TGL1_9RHOB|nr:host attachment family protein [Thioclava dalianensis]KEP70779.1 Host attachment protein [Thioclava dalianensis]TMV89494.1 host attachment protein [Thioclava sp. BHET1]SFN10542.1 Protein required for attachment to host cells [Thioclava dalianensis]
MTELKSGTWVVIADGEKALFLENTMDAEDPYLVVRRIDEQENPADHAQGTDRPGRMADNGMGQRSALDDTDWHQLAKMRFADDLADTLFKLVHKGRIERLVIAAAPRILGEVRQKLHSEVSNIVVGEIDKTLTNHPIDEIEKIVAGHLKAA